MLVSSPFSLGAFSGHEVTCSYSGREVNMADALGESGRALLGNGKTFRPHAHVDVQCAIAMSAAHSLSKHVAPAGVAYILAVRDPADPSAVLAGTKYGRPAGIHWYPDVDALAMELGSFEFRSARCHSTKKVDSPFGNGKQPLLPRFIILGSLNITGSHAQITAPFSAHEVTIGACGVYAKLIAQLLYLMLMAACRLTCLRMMRL